MIDFAQTWPPADPLTLMVVALVGLCLGSFLNVVIYRLPRGLSLLRPRSSCPRCGHAIRPWHNVPVAGWIWLRGRCHDCREPIPARYPLIELLGGGLALLAVLAFPSPWASLGAWWLLFALLAVFVIDLEHRIIPDEISLGGTALGLLLSPATLGLRSALGGVAIGAGSLYLISWIYQKRRGRSGMGLGDVKLAAMLGAFLGIQGVVLTIILASLLGSVLGIGLILFHRASRTTALPFGSFLAPAAVAAALWGPRIWAWYAGMPLLR